MPPTWSLENKLRKKGFKLIAGIDEVGRGPLAGPVVAAAVILPEKANFPELDDSKKLTPLLREKLYREILDKALAFGLGQVEVAEIDKLNIFQATFKAMALAVANLAITPDCLLIDGPHPISRINLPQWPIVKGDEQSFSIAAASVIAKVTRDRIMERLAEKFPEYKFNEHKGYGTSVHLEAIFKNGLTPHHRKSFCVKKQLSIFHDF